MAGYRGSFYFVNKDCSNLTRKDANEAFRINSHVANKYCQWVKGNRNKHPSGSDHQQDQAVAVQRSYKSRYVPGFGPAFFVAEGEAHLDVSTTDINRQTICWQLGSCSKGIAQELEAPHNSTDPLDQPVAAEHNDEQFLNLDLWPTESASTGCPSLPKTFDFSAPDWAACPRFQREALAHFRGYLSFFQPYNYKIANQANSSGSLEAAWHKRAIDLVTDRKSLHGWYASVLSLKALYLQPEHFTFIYPMALKHQNKSLTLLREYICDNSGSSAGLLSCIWYIGSAAFYQGDFAAMLSHVAAMWEIIGELGGFDSLDSDLQQHVILADNSISRFTLARPHLHRSDFDPGALENQPDLEQIYLLLSTTGFPFHRWDASFLLPEDALSVDLEDYVMAHREFVAAHILASGLQSETEQDNADILFYWLHRRRLALASWTMTLFCDITETMATHTRLSRRIRRQLQACLCLAFSYATSFIYGYNRPVHGWLLYIPIQHLRPQIVISIRTHDEARDPANINIASIIVNIPWHHAP